MKKHYNLGPDPKLKHRAQMGETTLQWDNLNKKKNLYKLTIFDLFFLPFDNVYNDVCNFAIICLINKYLKS